MPRTTSESVSELILSKYVLVLHLMGYAISSYCYVYSDFCPCCLQLNFLLVKSVSNYSFSTRSFRKYPYILIYRSNNISKPDVFARTKISFSSAVHSFTILIKTFRFG
uniref:Uncharacterized protein n=1 Tax=Schistocephalus solidus TaxID=70667 RepID=A0A0V0J2X9_SCHSO